eukprot:TRINITY_DN1195_c0_g2_i16.p6 TRINITY_DN1195_c0_g2~~TRINITY_DN1195_c0_g2_i16.p6  ORF type:complete len:120 (-),score=0.59 TRINITY_DN1195_c0_g2_i16:546-905(-)
MYYYLKFLTNLKQQTNKPKVFTFCCEIIQITPHDITNSLFFDFPRTVNKKNQQKKNLTNYHTISPKNKFIIENLQSQLLHLGAPSIMKFLYVNKIEIFHCLFIKQVLQKRTIFSFNIFF